MGKKNTKGTPRKQKTNRKPKPNGGAAAFERSANMTRYVMKGQASGELQKAYRRGEGGGYARTAIVTMWVLHTKYGFGRQRLMPFMQELAEFCSTHLDVRNNGRKGYHGISLADMRDQLFEEMGVWINMTGGRVWIQEKPYNREELPPIARMEGNDYFRAEEAEENETAEATGGADD